MSCNPNSSRIGRRSLAGIGSLALASTALLPAIGLRPPIGEPRTEASTIGATVQTLSTAGPDRPPNTGFIFSRVKCLVAVSLFGCLGMVQAVAGYSWICREPGGKRLVRIDDKEIAFESDRKAMLTIDPDNFILDKAGKRLFIVDDDDVRPGATPGGVKIANFDGGDIRHGAGGKVMINYRHPELCPTSAANRIYSIEGPALTKAQLVAGLYLLKPEMFRLSDEENAAQLAEMKKNAAEQAQRENADQIAGKWTMLNSNGIQEKLGKGTITVAPKKGDAYPVTFDHSKDGGPLWSGVGVYKYINGDRVFWTAYGNPKTVGLCVYEIKDGGVLEGRWYPWYIDGSAKNVGTENLKGPDSIEGDFNIVSAKAPATGAAYAGTVTLKPLKIVGAPDDAQPYQVTWKLGATVIKGMGLRSGRFLFVSSGTGADVNIARFQLGNGTMNSSWYKLGSDEYGSAAAMSDQ